MGRLDGPLAKRLLEAEEAVKGQVYVDFLMVDKETDDVLKEVKAKKRATYRIVFRI